ncbi:MAG: hypothetical protein ACR2NH_10320, partial [Solirubrobacteraceae bacterium]
FGQPDILRTYIWPGLRLELGISGLVIGLGVLTAIGLAAWTLRRAPRRPARAHAALGVGVLTLLVGVMYTITPGSAYGPKDFPADSSTTIRGPIPAMLVGAAATAWAASRLPRPARVVAELAGVIAVIDALDKPPDVPLRTAVPVALALAVLATAGVLIARRLRDERPLPGWTRPLAIGAGVAFLAAGLAVGCFQQKRFLEIGYARLDPTFAWIQASPSTHRVGIAGLASLDGTSPVLPAFGPRLRNRVAFIGPKVRESLGAYSTEAEFLAAVRRDDYDLLLVGRGLDPKPNRRSERWVQATGFRLVAESRRLALYARPPR